MLHTVRLVPRSYIPDKIEKGMYFFTDRIIQIQTTPHNQDIFMQEYGYPVEFYLVDEDPNQRWTNIVATPQQIGWFDFDPDGEDFAEMTVDHLNIIALEYDGWCQIDVWYDNLDDEEVQDDYIKVMPELLEGKVIIHTLDYEEDEEDWDGEEWQWGDDGEPTDEDDDDDDWDESQYDYDETDLDDDTWKE